MNKIKFCEALYALCGDDVVCRRKTIILPVAVTLIGMSLPLVGVMLEDSIGETLNSVLVMGGAAVALFGAVWLLLRLASSGEPYHKSKRGYLKDEVLSFDRSHRDRVLSHIASGDYKALKAEATSDVSSLTVLVYASSDGSFVAAQAFEYAELEYRKLCDVTVMQQ